MSRLTYRVMIEVQHPNDNHEGRIVFEVNERSEPDEFLVSVESKGTHLRSFPARIDSDKTMSRT